MVLLLSQKKKKKKEKKKKKKEKTMTYPFFKSQIKKLIIFLTIALI